MSIKLETLADFSPEQLLEFVDMREPPFDPVEIISRLKDRGLAISYSEDDCSKRDFSGEIKASEGEVSIWINPMTSPNRRRFTAAHELGHLCLDLATHNDTSFTDTEISLRRSGLQEPREFAANNFAGRLLMPKVYFIRVLNQFIDAHKQSHGKDSKVSVGDAVIELAEKFNVSPDAAKVRMKVLGII